MSIAPTTSSSAAPATCPASERARVVSSARRVEKRRQDDGRREDVLGETACRACGGGIVGLDRVERVGGLLHRAEEAKPRARGQMVLCAGGLDDARSAARE